MTSRSDTTYAALGPAVSFEGSAPVTSSDVLRREVDFSIPVNPEIMPSKSRMRHVEVLYQGPRAKTPRAVPVASPRIEPDGAGGYVLRFSAPWLGSYQAVVQKNAGEGTHKRRLTHRVVLDFSMGGGGAASFGMRHHDKFDANSSPPWSLRLHVAVVVRRDVRERRVLPDVESKLSQIRAEPIPHFGALRAHDGLQSLLVRGRQWQRRHVSA